MQCFFLVPYSFILVLLQRHCCSIHGLKIHELFTLKKAFLHEVLQRLSSAASCLCCSLLGVSSSWYLQVKINPNKNFRLFWIELGYNCIVSKRVLPWFLQREFLAPYSCLGHYTVQPIKKGRCIMRGGQGDSMDVRAKMEERQWPPCLTMVGGLSGSSEHLQKSSEYKWGMVGGDSADGQCPFHLPSTSEKDNSSSNMESWSTSSESRPTSFPPGHSLAEPEGRRPGLRFLGPQRLRMIPAPSYLLQRTWVSKCSRTQIILLKHRQWPRNLATCVKSSRSKN